MYLSLSPDDKDPADDKFKSEHFYEWKHLNFDKIMYWILFCGVSLLLDRNCFRL